MLITYFVQCEKQTVYSSTEKKKKADILHINPVVWKIATNQNVSFSNIFCIYIYDSIMTYRFYSN